MANKNANPPHYYGEKNPAYKHGFYKRTNVLPIYRVWLNMRTRCNNPNNKAYPNYGGRGIKVCEEWNNFATFYSNMGDKPEGMSLDRIDNDKGYSKENCRWATWKEQNNNKRPARRNRWTKQIG